ncbi:Na/Pi cotransporter family protein [Hydrogenimonas sp.]
MTTSDALLPSLMEAAGGLGIFLLGMIIMTDGLKALAGGTIHRWLMRFTKSPLSGAVTGAVGTAILQSSSATTVAAVGFVAAGLMEFSQALGIIFGANVGTTVTGWIVALFGFKLKITALAMPLVLVGALMKLLSRGSVGRVGYAVAGFGLIFVGIGLMQEGMEGFRHLVSFADLPADTWYNRFRLFFLGMLFTLVTQSSSAGVAATLTALYAGLVTFEQAAVLVVGMDVATAVTAVIASIGSSVQAKRTGFSHLIYNFFTGAMALLLVTPYTLLVERMLPGFIENDAEIALVAFHTLFNLLGLVAILPFASHFARFMERLIPERLPSYLRKLDRDLLNHPSMALDALSQTVYDEILRLSECLKLRLDPRVRYDTSKLDEIDRAIEAIYDYIDDLHLEKESRPERMKLLEIVHTVDHLQTLCELCTRAPEFLHIELEEIDILRESVRQGIAELEEYLLERDWETAVAKSMRLHKTVDASARRLRADVIAAIAKKSVGTDEGSRYLDMLAWLAETIYHLGRITYHYRRSVETEEKSEKR